jgi:hypothetical protein
MADITITFGNTINQSLQVGDIVYFEKEKDIVELGECTSIANDRLSLVADIPDTNIRPSSDSFFMFAKNNVINTSGLVGYHATVTLENTSTELSELFAVNSEVNISSN